MIKRIKINNFGNISEMDFECTKVNIFQGNSESGKSSILQAISWAILGSNDENIIKLEEKNTEVILWSDNGTRMERRLSRGGTNKFFVYDASDNSQPKPQELVNKIFNPLLFNPSKMVDMSTKELNSFISEAMSKRLKLTDEQINFYGLQEVDLSKDPLQAINGFYKTIYDQRTEVNRNVKTMEAKLGSSTTAAKKITQEEIDTLEVELKNKKAELTHLQEYNAKIDVGKRNLQVKDATEKTVNRLREELNYANLEDVDTLKNELKQKKEIVEKKRPEFNTLKNNRDNIKSLLEKLSNNEIICPYSKDITCKTNMQDYKTNLTKEIEKLNSEGKILFTDIKTLDEEISTLETKIEIAQNMVLKKLELSRAESILEQLQIVDGEPIDTTSLEESINDAQNALSEYRINLELSKMSGFGELKKRQEELDANVKSVDRLIKEIIPNMLTLNIPGVTINKDGVFYKELPLYRLADSVKLRLCTAILKDIFPKANIYNLDGLEKIDSISLVKFIDKYAKEDNGIQYFGTVVGRVSMNSYGKIKIFNVDKFQLV